MSSLPKYKFADFTFDAAEETLCKAGEPQSVNPKTLRVLRLLLEQAGNVVKKEEFFEKVWAETFVGDNNLTVAVAQIRRVLGETKDAKFIETVPKKGYRFTRGVEVIGSAEETKISDKSEIVAEIAELKRETNKVAIAAEKETFTEAPARDFAENAFAAVAAHKVLFIVGLLSSIFLISAFWRQSPAPVKIEPLRSIAVLPLAAIDGAPDTAIFAEKLTQDLIYNLGRITDVKVSAYEATAKFDAPDVDFTKIGGDLQIDGAIVGNIKTNGAMTDLEIRLNDLRSGANVWEKRYSLNAVNLAESQYRLARDIAREIGKNNRTNNNRDVLATAHYEAYQEYLTARHHLGKNSLKDTEKAVEHFTAATVKDASFADAHAGLATAHIRHGIGLYAAYGLSASRQSLPAASERARRALELNPQSDEALAALAFVNYRYEYDWTGAETNFRKAVEINPNNFSARRWFGDFLHKTGRFDAGFAEQKHALTLAPGSAHILNEMAWGAYLAHRLDEAAGYLKQAQAIDRTDAAAFYNASEIYECKRHDAEAFAAWREAMIIESANRKWIARFEEAFQTDGARGFARVKTDWLLNLTEKDYVYPTDLAKGYAALGNDEKAVEWLNRAVEAKAPDVLSTKYAPIFDRLKTDARFQKILQKMDFPE